MILEQHYLACLAQSSYLLVDEATRTAIVVDPRRDVELYLERARELGAEIRHVFLTHFHADFLSGHLELAERTGATIHLGAAGEADYSFEPAHEGDRLELGSLAIEVRETPGHTPESITLLVYDLAEDRDVPHAILTGDTLFIGDVGRPDLMASVGHSAEELAEMLFQSLRSKILPLPDEVLVYPGHGAGSACGKNLSSDTVSTVGEQRNGNWALAPIEKEEFVRRVTEGLPPAPAYFSRTAALNKERRGTLERVLERSLVPMSLEEVLAARSRGAQVLDVRSKDAFAAGHLGGSTNIGLDGKFASWAGSLMDLERPIVLVAEPGTEAEAATRLGRIGLDHVTGYLERGFAALRGREEGLVASVARTGADELARDLAGPHPPFVLDVRAPHEYEAGRIETARNVPLPELEERLDELPRDRRTVIHCQSGYRSMTAASRLLAHGFSDVVDLAGGYLAWAASGQASRS